MFISLQGEDGSDKVKEGMLDFLSNRKKKREEEERSKQEEKRDEKMRQEEFRSIRQALEANMRKMDELMKQDRRNTER